MNVVDDVTIFGDIRNAIMLSETNGTSIERIELTPTEMQDLLNIAVAKDSADKFYASMLNEWALHTLDKARPFDIGGNTVELPAGGWVKYVRIIVTPT